jgi:hypothetical protein
MIAVRLAVWLARALIPRIGETGTGGASSGGSSAIGDTTKYVYLADGRRVTEAEAAAINAALLEAEAARQAGQQAADQAAQLANLAAQGALGSAVGYTGATAAVLDAVGGSALQVSDALSGYAKRAQSDPLGTAADIAYHISGPGMLAGLVSAGSAARTEPVSTTASATGQLASSPEDLAAAAKSRGAWMKIAAALGLTAAAAAAIWLVVRGKGGGKKRAKKPKKRKMSKPRGKRKVRGRGRGARAGARKKKGKSGTRADIVDAGTGANRRRGSGRKADTRRGGGVSDKSVKVRRLRAAMKGAKKMKGDRGRRMRAGIRKSLHKLHARA